MGFLIFMEKDLEQTEIMEQCLVYLVQKLKGKPFIVVGKENKKEILLI